MLNLRSLLRLGFLACFAASLTLAARASGFSAAEPVLITSAGQSADALILKTLFTRAGLKPAVSSLAKPEELKDVKTLVIAIGGSSKGLGAAGIDANKERARVASLLAAAKSAGIPVVGLHVGGAAKRGELSDEFFTQVAGASSYLVVLKDGDEDGFMAKAAANAKVELRYIEKLAGLMPVIKEIFGKQ